ncbi:hypothetical protein V8E36_002609 [Tilletia maclaganii]
MAAMRPKTEYDLGEAEFYVPGSCTQHDYFEAVDARNARCLVCPAAPVFANRKIQTHRDSLLHQSNLLLPAHRLSTESAAYRPKALQMRAPRSPSLDSEAGYNDLDDYSGFLAELPPLPRSQFERDWNRMQELEDTAWQRDEQSNEEREMIAEIRSRLAAESRRDDDKDFWPWPDRGTFLLSLVVFAPRTPLSRTVTELVIAFANAVKHYEVPTLSAFRSATEKMRLRSPTKAVQPSEGSSGVPFFFNSIASGIAKDFGNPAVRERLYMLPRRARVKSQLRDGEAMAAPAPLALTTGHAVLPTKWYTDEGGATRGVGHRLRVAPADARRGRRIEIVEENAAEFDLTEVTRDTLLAGDLQGLDLYDAKGNQQPTSHPLRAVAKGKPVYSVPLLVWENDWRGTVSQNNYSHTSILYSNAALDRRDLDNLTTSVHFFSTSAAAEPADLLDALVRESNELYQKPFFVWDSQMQSDVLIRPYILALVGDTVMLNKLASSIGVQGNLPCRLCDWGGTQAYKHSKEGVEAALQVGDERTSESVVAQLSKQLDLAQADQTKDLLAAWKETGIKDPATTDACTILLETNDKLKGKAPLRPGQRARALPPAEVQQRLSDLRASLVTDTWHSPLHNLVPFGGLDCTPIDPLHIIFLGPGTFLAKETKEILIEYPAATMIARLNTLNGKEVKVLSQLMPFVLAPLVEADMAPSNLLDAWESYARLSRLMYVEYIDSLDEYEPQSELCGWPGRD